MTGNEPRPEQPGDQPPTTHGDPVPPARPDDRLPESTTRPDDEPPAGTEPQAGTESPGGPDGSDGPDDLRQHRPGEAAEPPRPDSWEPTSSAADSPQPGYPPSGHGQTGYPTPGYAQPGYEQTGHPEPGYAQPGYPQSGYTQPGYSQPGYTQPGYSQPGYPPSGYPQPGYTHPGDPTGGYRQYTYPQPGYQQPGYTAGYTGAYTVYPYPPYQVPRTDDGPRTLAIAALVSNIAVSLLCCPLVGIAGIVLSTMALSRSERDPDSARKLITWSWAALAAAIVTGITAIALLIALSPGE